ncbi:MAG: zinc ABC transporter substrate-binding protein [Ectothiorhodospiraceae bacterium]|nr:zinc ABC transporter substrate-binding protein [Ectothiorhodospiraceae bacterium]
MNRILLATLLMMVSGLASAQLNVVASTSNMGMLAETVGGEHVSVRVLAPPDRDAHYLEVRPNMMVALRRADLVVSVGAELEVGWLPLAIERSNNPRLNPGRSGYFEAGAQVDRLDEGAPADRSLGDVHPTGNPHVYMDPLRMADVAEALAERMAELDGDNADSFRRNAAAFRDQAESAVERWREEADGAPGVVLFHEDAKYLLELLGVPELGYLEPVPGVPPTASHLQSLVRGLDGREGVIIYSGYHSSRGPDFVAGELGWNTVVLPTNVEVGGSAEDYFALLDRWVSAISRLGS